MSSTVNRAPSVRARGAFDALVPDGWQMDEWRGGGCAAVVTTLNVDGEWWEVCILPDGHVELPHADQHYSTWQVHANHHDTGTGDTWELRTHLDLPAYREGDQFPTDKALDWARDAVRTGQAEAV